MACSASGVCGWVAVVSDWIVWLATWRESGFCRTGRLFLACPTCCRSMVEVGGMRCVGGCCVSGSVFKWAVIELVSMNCTSLRPQFCSSPAMFLPLCMALCRHFTRRVFLFVTLDYTRLSAGVHIVLCCECPWLVHCPWRRAQSVITACGMYIVCFAIVLK